MLLLDSILAAPGKAVVALFQELAKKAQEEFLDDDVVKKELQEIYALVEGGRISDSEFESRESLLLARLEEIARVKFGIAAGQAALPAADGSVIEDGAGEEPAFIEVEEPGLIVQQGMVVRPLTTPPVIAEPPLRLPDGLSAQAIVEALVAARAGATDWPQEPPRMELLPWSAVEAAAPPQIAPTIAAPAPATVAVAADSGQFFTAPAPATPPVAAMPSAPPFDSRFADPLAQGRAFAAPAPVPAIAAPIFDAPPPAPFFAAPAPATPPVAAMPSGPPFDSRFADPLAQGRAFAAPPPAPAIAPPVFDAPPPAPVFAAPPAVAAPVDSRFADPLAQGSPAAAPAPAPVRLNLGQVVEAALGGLSVLKLKVSSVTSVNRAGDGWQVVVEVLERRGVPDTSDLLGVYELHLDEAGNILRYERTRIRRRCDLGR
jgi:hypothetical protein